ncbi:MAG: M48 family metallopeptidase [Treponema sp.]|nr:M48 family metallopeptidase [Treponema sp.]
MNRFLFKAGLLFFSAMVLITSCSTNPFTGKRTMAFVGNNTLFASSFVQYQQFLSENRVITGTPEAEMINNAGNKIRMAAEKWAASVGQPGYLSDYRWEFTLIDSNEINAWAMPGGKIVFYRGILPVTRDEAGIAVVMGHEAAHAILNHGQQRVSANILQQIGAVGVSILASEQTPETQALAMTIYGAGSTLFGTLPYSRAHEIEADQVGLTLMIIAGYDPESAAAFWERMSSLGGGSIPQFLSTHPSDTTRINALRRYIPEARKTAERIGIIQ